MRKYVIVAAGLLLALVLGATVLSDPIAYAAQKAKPKSVLAEIVSPLDGNGKVAVHEQGTANVNVTNAQLAVHEQGTVPASQSGAWHVSVDGTPTVKSGDVTTLAGTFVGTVPGGGAFTEAVDADVSHYRTVRVLTNCFSGGICANIQVNVYSIVGSRSYLLDQFPMQNFLSQSRTYDVLGESIAVQLQSSNTGPISNVGVAVYGRAN